MYHLERDELVHARWKLNTDGCSQWFFSRLAKGDGRNRIGRREKKKEKFREEGKIDSKSKELGEIGSESREKGDLPPCCTPLRRRKQLLTG